MPLCSHTFLICAAELAISDRLIQRERISLGHREAVNCEALRMHMERFSTGAYRMIAANLLAVRCVVATDV